MKWASGERIEIESPLPLREYRYISRRLVTEVVQQGEALRSQSEWTVGIDVKVVHADRSRRPPDFDNLFDLAVRTTEIAGGRDLGGGSGYWQTTMELALDHLLVHRWRGAHNRRIAAVFGDEELDGLGHTFVALFGSMSGYLGFEAEEHIPAWFPSDVAGLYGILGDALEPSDPQPPWDADDDHEIADESRASGAHGLRAQSEHAYPAQRCDVLAKVSAMLSDQTYADEHFDTVVLGAPVWIASASKVGSVR